MKRSSLTNSQCWLIVCSPEQPAPVLAEVLGAKVSTIRNARARFRHHGWSCRVVFVACRRCGELLTQQGFRNGRQAYHQVCRPAARQVIQKRLDAARWERLNDVQRDTLLNRRIEADSNHQEHTKHQATQAYQRWSVEDQEYLICHWHEPAHHVAQRLGRSLYAVRARRSMLMRRELNPVTRS